MICPSCDSENIEGTDVCENCGASLSARNLPGAQKGRQAPDFVHYPLAGLPKHQVAQVGPSDPVSLAVRLMQTQDVSSVLVMQGDQISGIITGWDILQKVAGATEDLTAVTCGQIMTPEPQCLHEDDSLSLALNLMASGHFRHVPIVDGDKPLTVVDVNDLFRQISPNLV